MNLYNIYDSESGLCLGKKKTAGQIANLFGISQNNIYQNEIRGYLLLGKYRLELETTEEPALRPENASIMKEWDDVTRKAREYFKYVRDKRGTKNGIRKSV